MTHAFFRRRIGSPDIAAEQNQELYVRVVEHLASFRGDSAFKTWLFRLAHNQISHLRRRWRVHLDEHPEELPDHIWEQIEGEDDTPDDELGKDRRTRALRRCLAALPAVERAVVIGQYYQEIKLRELTRELRLDNPSGARAALIAGQRKLRRCLEAAGITSGETS